MSRLSLVISLCFIFFTSYTQVGYVKRFNGAPDWLEIAGKNSFGGAIDGGTMTLNRTSGNQNFQTYLFNRKGTSNTTLVAFRQDSAANSKSIGVLITRDSIKVIKRTSKAGVSTILSKYAAPTANAYWIRISRNGTGFSAFFSTSSPDVITPSWTLLNTTSGAFIGWADAYWKALGVASNSTTLASSEFARSQNGAWLGTNTDTTTTTPTKPSCNCGFSLVSVAQVSNSTTGQFSFNSCNVSELTWKIKATASSTVNLATGTVTVTSSTVSFSIPSSMTTGTYYLEVSATNCTGTDTKSFSYTQVGTCVTPFTLQTITQTSATAGTFTLDVGTVGSIIWNLKNSAGTTISTGSYTNISTSNATQTFTIPSSASGVLTLEIVGVNCSGSSSKTFTYNSTCTFAIASTTQTSATSGTASFTACSATSATWKLKSGTIVLSQGSFSSLATSQTFTVPTGTATGIYVLEVVGTNGTSSWTATTNFTYISACDCGFTIESVSQISDTQGQFVFGSCGVYNLVWNLKNPGGQIIATATVQNSAGVPATQTFNIPANTTNGIYTIEGLPQNCGGFSSKTFTYTKAASYITVSPSTLSVGSGASVNYISVATNLSGIAVSSSDSWLTVTTCGTCGGGYYTVQTTATTVARSGTITFSSGSTTATLAVIQGNTSTSIKSESNVAKNIAKIANGVTTIPLSYFKNTSGETITYLDAQQERRNSWAVWFQGGNIGFDTQNIMPWQVNLAGSMKYMKHFGGFATRGLDYVLTSNPDNPAEIWTTDPQTTITYPPAGVSFTNFISRIYPENRFEGAYNLGYDPHWTQEQYYDQGKGYAQSNNFGYGDNVSRNGLTKTQRGLNSADIENYIKQPADMAAFIIGMAEGSTGLCDEMYAYPFNEYGSSVYYDTPTETYSKRLFDYPDYPGYPNDYRMGMNPIWDYQNPTRITIASRNVTNKSVIDYPNAQPSAEVSSYESWWLPQGSTDTKADGSTYVINKFGTNIRSWTATHPLMHHGALIEKWSWYSLNKLGRRFKAMAKLIADKGPAGSEIPSRQNTLCNRKYGFQLGLLTYMNGCDWHIWGEYSNMNTSIDGYIGSLAMIDMVRKSGGIAAFPDMTPLFWDSEYSLDGVNWKKSKAVDWADNTTDVLPVRIKVGVGKMEVAAFRSEGVEPLEFWARATINGIVRTIHVTSSDWETTDPSGSGKEYFYKLLTY